MPCPAHALSPIRAATLRPINWPPPPNSTSRPIPRSGISGRISHVASRSTRRRKASMPRGSRTPM
jgi:hypothetical protein